MYTNLQVKETKNGESRCTDVKKEAEYQSTRMKKVPSGRISDKDHTRIGNSRKNRIYGFVYSSEILNQSPEKRVRAKILYRCYKGWKIQIKIPCFNKD